jgi:prepilin-type N-terminal cleavage/methylation domain-containing protein
MVSRSFLKKGFTLIELLLTLGVLLFFFLIVTQGLTVYQHSVQTQELADLIITDLNFIRSQALTSGRDSYLDFQSNSYSGYSAAQIIFQRTVPSPYKLNKLKLGFKSNGHPAYSGTIIIYRQGLAVIQISLVPASGLINKKRI